MPHKTSEFEIYARTLRRVFWAEYLAEQLNQSYDTSHARRPADANDTQMATYPPPGHWVPRR